jgi:LPS export ABC transporter protein LptC
MRPLVFLALSLFWIGCSELPDAGDQVKKLHRQPDQIIWNGRIEVVTNGKLESIVQARRIETFEKEKVTTLDSGVVVDFYDKNGKHSSRLTSQSARVEDAKNLFLARGNVVVVSDSGDVLRTERLYWDQQKQKITSDTLVILVTRQDSLRGFNFESNDDLTSWQLTNATGQTTRTLNK